MKNPNIEIEISDFKDCIPSSELHQFWYAILSFNAFEFYLLLNEDINLYSETKETFTEKLNRKICAHQLFGDEEYILVLDKEEILNSSIIICDFTGCVKTGFSTKLKFEVDNEKVKGISFIEDDYDIEKVFDLYTLDEFLK